MAINPVGPVEVSPQPALDSSDRRFESWTARKPGAGSSPDGEVGDRVFLSDAAREIASIVAREELKPNLSAAELRAMITPRTDDPLRLKSAQGTDDSSSNAGERHVR